MDVGEVLLTLRYAIWIQRRSQTIYGDAQEYQVRPAAKHSIRHSNHLIGPGAVDEPLRGKWRHWVAAGLSRRFPSGTLRDVEDTRHAKANCLVFLK